MASQFGGITVDFDTDAAAVEERIRSAGRQLPFALAGALTSLAHEVRSAERKHMNEVFDRPTPYTLNAFRVMPARKDSLVAEVSHKDIRSRNRYLEVEEAGGPRPMTGTERLISQRWAGPMFAMIPTPAAQIDRYGNLRPSQRNRILSVLKVQRDSLSNETERSRKRAKRRVGYFVPRPSRSGEGGLTPGVYERRGLGIELVLLFLTKGPAVYRPRFRFFEVAQATAAARFGPIFKAHVDWAWATAGFRGKGLPEPVSRDTLPR